MEILHFCPSRSYSGLEQYAFQMAADQKQKGHSVGFVVYPGSKLQEECTRIGIEVIPFDFHNYLGVFKFWRLLIELMKKHPNLSVIHLHSTQEIFHLFGAVIYRKYFQTVLKQLKIPKIILQIHIWINHRKLDPFHKLIYSVVDEVWCSSTPARKTLLENLPITPEQIRVVNYGRDISKTESGFLSKVEAREKLSIPLGAVVFGTVSRIEKSKGVREFIHAGVEMLRGHEEVHLAVIGSPSPNNPEAETYYQEILSFVDTLEEKKHNRVHFLGALPDSFKYLRAFDVYVLPSYEECFSLSLLDAQLAGLPVLGTQSGGTPEVVHEAQTGWLAKPQDKESLRLKLESALKVKDQWPTYGARASHRVKKDFDQKSIFDRIIKNYGM
jgi:glycosyltransferase involved in cell wall biosynthesis